MLGVKDEKHHQSGSHHSKFQFMTCIERLGHRQHCRKLKSEYEAFTKFLSSTLFEFHYTNLFFPNFHKSGANPGS